VASVICIELLESSGLLAGSALTLDIEGVSAPNLRLFEPPAFAFVDARGVFGIRLSNLFKISIVL
jgi:hypothetical protein